MTIAHILQTTENFHIYFFVILVLLILSFIISMVLSIYLFGIKENKNAAPFSLIMAICTIWSLKRILQLFISDLELRGLISKCFHGYQYLCPGFIIVDRDQPHKVTRVV